MVACDVESADDSAQGLRPCAETRIGKKSSWLKVAVVSFGHAVCRRLRAPEKVENGALHAHLALGCCCLGKRTTALPQDEELGTGPARSRIFTVDRRGHEHAVVRTSPGTQQMGGHDMIRTVFVGEQDCHNFYWRINYN